MKGWPEHERVIYPVYDAWHATNNPFPVAPLFLTLSPKFTPSAL